MTKYKGISAHLRLSFEERQAQKLKKEMMLEFEKVSGTENTLSLFWSCWHCHYAYTTHDLPTQLQINNNECVLGA